MKRSIKSIVSLMMIVTLVALSVFIMPEKSAGDCPASTESGCWAYYVDCFGVCNMEGDFTCSAQCSGAENYLMTYWADDYGWSCNPPDYWKMCYCEYVCW